MKRRQKSFSILENASIARFKLLVRDSGKKAQRDM